MDRKLIWTEKASSDIEAIVRYIARRDPKAAARIGLGIYDRAQILIEHPEAEQFSTNCAKLVGESSSSGDGKSFTRSALTISLSAEYGRPRWAKRIWKRRFK
jgi:plasmid stabilization system protein ParE